MAFMTKILTYGIIMLVVRATLDYGMHYKKKSKLNNVEYELYKKGYANALFGMGILLTVMFAFIFTLPSNLHGAAERNAHLICIAFTLFLFLFSFALSRWHFIIMDGEILCRTCLGKEKKIPLLEVSGFKINDDQELIIYQQQEKVFVIDNPEQKYDAMLALSEHGIPNLEEETSEYEVERSRNYKNLLTGVAVFIGGGFAVIGFAADTPVFVLVGIVSFLVIYILCAIDSSEKYIVSKDRIRRTKMFAKPVEVAFDEVKKVEDVYENNTHYYYFYVNDKVVIKVMMLYKNADKLKELAIKKRWLVQ